jgi:hypothetical protein
VPQYIPKVRRRPFIESVVLSLVLFSSPLLNAQNLADADGVSSFPRRAPFSGVRWAADAPEVLVGSTWYGLLAIDGVTASDIVSFCQHSYGPRWRKRFEEDLVAAMSQMNHPPGDKVSLTLRDLGSKAITKRPGVAMTEENRRAIWCASHGGCK